MKEFTLRRSNIKVDIQFEYRLHGMMNAPVKDLRRLGSAQRATAIATRRSSKASTVFIDGLTHLSNR